jgi:hypothetical protein
MNDSPEKDMRATFAVTVNGCQPLKNGDTRPHYVTDKGSLGTRHHLVFAGAFNFEQPQECSGVPRNIRSCHNDVRMSQDDSR